MIALVSLILGADVGDAAQNLVDSLNQGDISGWDLIAAEVVVVLSLPVARFFSSVSQRSLQRAGMGSGEAAEDVGRIVRWLVYLIGIALAASILGVDVGFLSVLFAFGLIILALMLKPMVENSASGILLVARPSFSVGDQIRTTEFRGSVENIGNRSTMLRQDDGVVVFVSNNQVLGNPIVVYSESDSRKASFDIRVPVDTDLDDITSLLTRAARSVDLLVDDPAPSVQATGLTDNAIKLSISYWYPATMINDADATDGVIRATTAALREANVQLMAPDVEVKGSPSTPASSEDGRSSEDARTEARAADAASDLSDEPHADSG